MREIKFRVWNGFEMVYDVMVGKFGVFYVNPGINGDGLDEKDSASLTPFNTKYSDTIPVMQYTGLKDKNGKEIYEGDLLMFFDKVIAVVVFQDLGGWSYKWIDETYIRVRQRNPEPFFHNITLWEVAGNIYETQNLLK